MIRNIYRVTSAILLILVVGCSESFLEKTPLGKADEELLTNSDGVDALLTGAYSMLDGSLETYGSTWASSVSNWVWGAVASDDAYKGSTYSDQDAINPIENFTVNTANYYVGNHWRWNFDAISRCNDVLKVMKGATDMGEAAKTDVEAQVRFLRGHFYLELTKIYGYVPYIDENTVDPGVVANDKMLWDEIEADLLFAYQNLPDRQDQVGRVHKYAAAMELARVHLFQQEYVEAAPILDDVIDNGGFTLMDNFSDNYMAAYNNNGESIFEVQYSVNDGSSGSANAGWGDALNFPQSSSAFDTGTCCGFFQPTQNLVNAFRVDDLSGLPLFDTFNDEDLVIDGTGHQMLGDADYTGNVDPRLDFTVGRPGVPYLDWGVHPGVIAIRDPQNGGPYLYKKNMFLKADKGSLSTTTGWATGVNANNYRVYRLAHAILWRAECHANAGDDILAIKLVNSIRRRVLEGEYLQNLDGTSDAVSYDIGLYPENGSIDSELTLKAIQWELRLEFAMEGHRFFDLRRWNIIDETMNDYIQTESEKRSYLSGSSFSKGKHEYWPIPLNQVDLSVDESGNKVLMQHNGWAN